MRIAHISDLHLWSHEPIAWRRMLNKRFTGWVNVKFRRGDVHKREVARAVAREIARIGRHPLVARGYRRLTPVQRAVLRVEDSNLVLA